MVEADQEIQKRTGRASSMNDEEEKKKPVDSSSNGEDEDITEDGGR